MALQLLFLLHFIGILSSCVNADTYSWKNVKIGGGGGFVPGIVFNPSEKGLAYARTDIGGAYRLNSDDSWTPLLDWVGNDNWNYWGVDALATDPVQTNRVYLAVGMYTNSWDPNNGKILSSTDKGNTWTVAASLSFKVGGNMPGRGMGERLVIDPNNNAILYFGARSGKGLWKSTNYGVTWTNVTAFTSTGNYRPDPSDSTGYNSDIIGISWITFDKSSGTSGTATPRIFVGVASNGTSNVFVSENAGSSWSAVSGQQTQFFPHRGVIDPTNKLLYVTYADGTGPYDGTNGAVYKYSITNKTWTNITPVSGSDLYFGFGGLSVDLLKPGTVMVAAVNSWWPDGQIFRSTDSGATWTALWEWVSYPTMAKHYTYSDSLAPWIGPNYVDTTPGNLQIGWMMEALAIDPFDSNHLLYGTGETIYGSHDLLNWDSKRNFSISSLADGIEETSVQWLISPPSGPNLLSAIGDVAGFAHKSLTTAPSTKFTNPTSSTNTGIDYAGLSPANMVRVGQDVSSTVLQVGLSTDSGSSWNIDYGAAYNVYGGKIAYSASADTVLWSSASSGVLRSQYQGSFASVSSLPSGSLIASDKANNSVFYAASGTSFYVSTNTASSFTAVSTLSNNTSPIKITVHPTVAGDVWVSGSGGIYHSTNYGTTFTKLSTPGQTWAISLGAAKSSGGYPALFAASTISGTVGYYRSDDTGATWTRIDDSSHGFGSASANVISGDPRIYGRVYIGTNGRGIFYGDVTSSSGTTTTTSTTSTTTSTTSTTTTSTTTSSAPGATQTAYGQCGGSGWTGPTACVSGYTCKYSNDFYSQCVPS